VVTGPGEQPLPGLAGPGRATIIVAGGPGGGPVTWTAAVSRVEPGSGEWDEVIGPLVAGRLNAVLAETETSPARRWARSGAVFRLAPAPPAVDRLPPSEEARLEAFLGGLEVRFHADPASVGKLRALRGTYEPYVQALSSFLIMPLPEWVPREGAMDTWHPMM